MQGQGDKDLGIIYSAVPLLSYKGVQIVKLIETQHIGNTQLAQLLDANHIYKGLGHRDNTGRLPGPAFQPCHDLCRGVIEAEYNIGGEPCCL
jgi:hypothetical protein